MHSFQILRQMINIANANGTILTASNKLINKINTLIPNRVAWVHALLRSKSRDNSLKMKYIGSILKKGKINAERLNEKKT